MQKYTIYIGSNNSTKELENDKAIAIISEVFQGFTHSKVKGYWQGSEEDTLRVEIMSDYDIKVVEQVCRKLKTYLEQDSILLEVSNPIIKFI